MNKTLAELVTDGIAESTIIATMLSLQDLQQRDPVSFYELVMWCRDRNHALWGDTAEILQARSMLHDLVRDVVLAAVTGEGGDMALMRL